MLGDRKQRGSQPVGTGWLTWEWSPHPLCWSWRNLIFCCYLWLCLTVFLKSWFMSRLNVIFSKFDEVQRSGNMVLSPVSGKVQKPSMYAAAISCECAFWFCQAAVVCFCLVVFSFVAHVALIKLCSSHGEVCLLFSAEKDLIAKTLRCQFDREAP